MVCSCFPLAAVNSFAAQRMGLTYYISSLALSDSCSLCDVPAQATHSHTTTPERDTTRQDDVMRKSLKRACALHNVQTESHDHETVQPAESNRAVECYRCIDERKNEEVKIIVTLEVSERQKQWVIFGYLSSSDTHTHIHMHTQN